MPSGIGGLASQLGVSLSSIDASQSPDFYAELLATPEVRAAYRAQDAVPVASAPAAFGTFLNDEIDKWGKAIRSAGVPIQE